MVVSARLTYPSLRRHPASARISPNTGVLPRVPVAARGTGTDRRRWCVPVERSCFQGSTDRGGKATMTEPEISQEMIRIYDEYTHLTLDRRGFMDKLTRLAGSAAAAAAIAPLIAANSAKAAIVAPDDSRVVGRGGHLSRQRRQHVGLSRHAREGRGQASRRRCHPREPRSQPAHRGRDPAPRAWRASWRWRPTSFHRSAVRPPTRTRRATCSPS